MDGISVSKSVHGSVVLSIKDPDVNDSIPPPSALIKKDERVPIISVEFMQKLLAELVGTYYLIFAGCAAIAVNGQRDDVVTLVGIAVVWGLAVMVLVHSLGHVSAHFNPAVTIAFASCSSKKHDVFIGTSPSGSNLQAFVMEFTITCFLMFVVCAMVTDKRAVKDLDGLIIGAAIILNVLFAGEISGASMNPARSLGPALVWSCYKGIWIYVVSPTLGAVSGAWIYNLLRCTDKPLNEITSTSDSLKRIHRVTPS